MQVAGTIAAESSFLSRHRYPSLIARIDLALNEDKVYLVHY